MINWTHLYCSNLLGDKVLFLERMIELNEQQNPSSVASVSKSWPQSSSFSSQVQWTAILEQVGDIYRFENFVQKVPPISRTNTHGIDEFLIATIVTRDVGLSQQVVQGLDVVPLFHPIGGQDLQNAPDFVQLEILCSA